MNTKKLFEKYVLNTYNRVGPVFVKGKGSWLWNELGKKYLDLFPGWGVSILGHSHPRIVKAIAKQAAKMIHLPNNLFSTEQALLAKEIVDNSFPAKVFFCNSGAEAVEGAIKLSRLYGKNTDRFEIITMKNSFHGRTFGAMSATGQSKYKDPFKPLLPGFIEAEFNDFQDLQNKLTDKTIAVMFEPIQGEGGINIIDQEYARKISELCRQRDLLLILDEVQTGMARTGAMFAFKLFGIKPDIMVLSKGLGAGVPIGAVVTADRIADIIKPGMHASTFGGSPLAASVSMETFKIIKEEKLVKRSAVMGAYLIKRLNEFKTRFSFIKEVRAKGLMAGIELSCNSWPIFMECLNRKLIINSTHGTVLRIMPALNVSRQDMDKGLDILEGVLKDFVPINSNK